MHRRASWLRTAVALAAFLLANGITGGGDWHRAETLVCSECHTVHNSEDGLPLRYDGVTQPAQELLRAEDATHLCLACHDGSRIDAPDVVAPVTYLKDPAGGWFAENPLGRSNPNGHDLLSVAPLQAPGSQDRMVLTCVSCHAPHGNDNFRNLAAEPPGTGSGGAIEVVAGGAGSWPGAGRKADDIEGPGGGPPPVSSYDSAALRYRSGMSAWCNDCHGDFHGTSGGETGASSPWMRHPQDTPIAGALHADYGHWSEPLPERIRVETPNDTDIPSPDDRVFCLSCHRAHGSVHRAGLIYADGSTMLATCQQCHNQ